MKKLLATLLTLTLTGCASHTPYFKVGAGLKLSETNHSYCQITNVSHLPNGKTGITVDGCTEGNHPISARIQLGFESDNFNYGIDHHSQWFSGAPVNNESEYQKTELFVDYVYRFKR